MDEVATLYEVVQQQSKSDPLWDVRYLVNWIGIFVVGKKSGIDGESGKTIRRYKASFIGNRVKVPAVGCW